jgi:hypothetical protein
MKRLLLAVLLVAGMCVDPWPAEEPSVDECVDGTPGCLCDGAQGECRVGPWTQEELAEDTE